MSVGNPDAFPSHQACYLANRYLGVLYLITDDIFMHSEYTFMCCWIGYPIFVIAPLAQRSRSSD